MYQSLYGGKSSEFFYVPKPRCDDAYILITLRSVLYDQAVFEGGGESENLLSFRAYLKEVSLEYFQIPKPILVRGGGEISDLFPSHFDMFHVLCPAG